MNLARPSVRILVVDDYEPFRRFVCSTLTTKPELQVIGEASDGLEAVQKAKELKPDLILLDIGLPTLNGFDASRRMSMAVPGARIIVVTLINDADIVREILGDGASAYVLKLEANMELLRAVEVVLRGGQFVSAGVRRGDGMPQLRQFAGQADFVEKEMSELSRITDNTQRSSLELRVFTSPTRVIAGDPNRTFSPTTSTLIFGARDAVLVDALLIKEDVDALGDMIASTGRTLTTIFITHGHGDHFFGSDRLIARFPGARAVTTQGIVDYINSHIEGDAQLFSSYFCDTFSRTTSRPSPLDRDIIDLEGHELRVIEVGQGDIAPTAVLHIPSLDAVVAGDVAYNQIHQMLAFGGPAEWDKWIASIGIIERLHPRIVVAGHKKPEAPDDEAEKILNGTRSYIQDFAKAARSFGTVEEIVGAMRSKYPDHGNLTTLLFSARAAVKARAS